MLFGVMPRFFVVIAGLLMLLPLLMKFVLHVIVLRTVPVGVLLLLPAGLMRFVPDGACMLFVLLALLLSCRCSDAASGCVVLLFIPLGVQRVQTPY